MGGQILKIARHITKRFQASYLFYTFSRETKKPMTLFFYLIIGLITFVAFLHTWAKKEFDLSRTIVINRSKAEVYAYVRQLRNQREWVSWFERDPNTQFKYKGEDGKEGASAYWKGNNKVGEGIQRIVKIKDGKVMEVQILLLKPYKTLCLIYFGVKEVEAEKTKLVCGLRGAHRFPASVLMLFYGMEKAFGAGLERGVGNLKRALESR